jgi:hypothetical protein
MHLLLIIVTHHTAAAAAATGLQQLCILQQLAGSVLGTLGASDSTRMLLLLLVAACKLSRLVVGLICWNRLLSCCCCCRCRLKPWDSCSWVHRSVCRGGSASCTSHACGHAGEGSSHAVGLPRGCDVLAHLRTPLEDVRHGLRERRRVAGHTAV